MRSVSLFAFATVILAVRMATFSTEMPNVFEPLFGQKITVEGVVVALPDKRETSDRITVELRSGIQSTRIIAAVPHYPQVHVGDVVRVEGTLKKPEPFDTDGGRVFAYDDFLRKDGVHGLMQPARAEVVGQTANLWFRFLRTLEVLKGIMMNLLRDALPEPESSLAAGVLVGGKQGLGTELIDAFMHAGMLQIIVLSGYNVMIVANTLMRLLIAVPKKIAFGVAVLSIACFVLIAGAGSSAMRAGLMAFFAIAAHAFNRKYDVLRVVFASIFLLGLWNPLMLAYDPGFQFSFIATLGLILLTPVIEPRLRWMRNATVIELFSTTLAAEIALLPFLLWQTGHLSLVSVFANVVAMPAVPYAMGLSVLAGALAFPLGYIDPVLPGVAGLAAYIPLAYIIRVATLSASLPFADVILPAFPFWMVILSYGGIALSVRFLSKPPRLENDVQR